MSPYQAHYRELRTLGKGGFGSVVSAMGRLDARAVAVKKIHFRSAVPPWAKNDALEAMHEEILREARALALMDHPRVVKYHSAWIEPRWSKLASVGKTKTSRTRAVITELDSDADDPHNIRPPSLIFPDAEAESSDDSDWDDDDSATESTDASVSADRRRRLLAPVSPARPENATSTSGIGYGELWTPAAAAAAALRWPYTLHVAMELCPGSTLRIGFGCVRGATCSWALGRTSFGVSSRRSGTCTRTESSTGTSSPPTSSCTAASPTSNRR